MENKPKVPGISHDAVSAGHAIMVTETAAIDAVMEMQIENEENAPDVPQAVTSVDTITVGMQTVNIFNPSDMYEVKISQLQEELKKLKERNSLLRRRTFDFERIVNSENFCVYYTGLSPESVLVLAKLLEDVATLPTFQELATSFKFPSVTILNLKNQLLLTLMRLWRDLDCQDLAFMFGIGEETIARDAFNSILEILHVILFQSIMKEIPSRERNQIHPAKCFKEYPNTRILLEFTEISCDIPHHMQQRTTSSSYESFNTIKWLIGSGTHGEVTYCSKTYPGYTSDKALIQHSEILSQMKPGDTVLADDTHFHVIAGILPSGVSLSIPPFLIDPQCTEDKIFESRLISGGRVIHIERINTRLKGFRILRHIPADLVQSCDLLVQTCCALINFQNPLSQK